MSWLVYAAGCCVYEVVHQAAFTSTSSAHRLTLKSVLWSDGLGPAAGLVIHVRLPSHQHFTVVPRRLASVAHGERLTSHALMVETLHRNWRPLCLASCLIGQLLIPPFRSQAILLDIASILLCLIDFDETVAMLHICIYRMMQQYVVQMILLLFIFVLANSVCYTCITSTGIGSVVLERSISICLRSCVVEWHL